MTEPYDLVKATEEAQERQRQVDANIAAVEQLHATVRAEPRRLARNRRLLDEARRLLDANARMQAMNDLVIQRTKAYLASAGQSAPAGVTEQRRAWRASLREGSEG